MEFWHWFATAGLFGVLLAVGAFFVKVSPAISSLLAARGAIKRQELADLAAERKQFADGLQATIDSLRGRIGVAEKDIRECYADRARLEQRIKDLEDK